MTAATDRELTCKPPARTAPPQPRPREPESPAPWVLRYALAVGVTALVCAVSLTLDRVLGDHAPLILSAVAAMVSPRYGGLGPGLLSTLLGALAGIYFFLAPTYSLTVARPTDWVNLGVFLVTGVVVSWLSEALHAAR